LAQKESEHMIRNRIKRKGPESMSAYKKRRFLFVLMVGVIIIFSWEAFPREPNIDSEFNRIVEDFQNLKNELIVTQEAYRALQNEYSVKLREYENQLSALKNEKVLSERLIAEKERTRKAQVDQLNISNKNKDKLITELKRSQNEYIDNQENHFNKIKKTEVRLKEYELKLAEHKSRLSALQDQKQALENSLREQEKNLRARINELSASVNDKERSLASLEREKADLLRDQKNTTEQLKNLERKSKDIENKLAMIQREKVSLDELISYKNKIIGDLERNQKDLIKEQGESLNTIRGLEVKVKEHENKIALLKQQENSLERVVA